MKKSGIEERDDRKVAGGCIPVRRKISSGGKEGSYADARTGGKQAYLALKKSKPPGSAGGWTKKNCICCHKCKNDRSAPNGFVCMNPAHLYWGSKADNTYDQNRGNGWAAENKKSLEENTYLKGEKIMTVTRAALRKLIREVLLKEQSMYDDLDPNVEQSGDTRNLKTSPWMSGEISDAEFLFGKNLGLDQKGEFAILRKRGMSQQDALNAVSAVSDASEEVAAIIDNTDPAYIQKTLDMRNPGGQIQAGSKFLDVMSIEDLKSADWEPLQDPNIKAPAIAFTASIPGKLGIVSIDNLADDQPVAFQLAHGGTGGKTGDSAELVAAFPDELLFVENTTLIAGPHNGKTVVWTFHPGDPSPPFNDILMTDLRQRYRPVNPEDPRSPLIATIGDAKAEGFNFVKRVESLPGAIQMNEFYRRWSRLAGRLR